MQRESSLTAVSKGCNRRDGVPATYAEKTNNFDFPHRSAAEHYFRSVEMLQPQLTHTRKRRQSRSMLIASCNSSCMPLEDLKT